LSGQNSSMKSEEIKKPSSNKKGSLTIVGSGFQAVRHLTAESKLTIEQADKVLYLVNDPVSELWVKKTNPNSESLMTLYLGGKYRPDTYKEMTEITLRYVRQGLNICVVYYGHPGVFVIPSHESIRQARAEGYAARMLPGISAEDCLFADLGIDPGTCGCQSFEATDFLLNRRKFDTRSQAFPSSVI
jgi:siroheme synthase